MFCFGRFGKWSILYHWDNGWYKTDNGKFHGPYLSNSSDSSRGGTGSNKCSKRPTVN